MKDIQVNLGQSTFQDDWFVIQSELTPFRQLRTIELQIKEIESALKKASIERRRTLLKIAQKDSSDPLEALDIEEYEYSLETQEALVKDAGNRLVNFQDRKRMLIESQPDVYWEAGFEAHEPQYWINFYARKMALEVKTHGVPLPSTMEKVMALPNDLIKEVFVLSDQNKVQLIQLETPDDLDGK